MKIGQAANHVGVVTETLRVWERKGLIPEVNRSPLGHRQYSAEDILKIQQVIRERSQAKSDGK